jgi:hypothetical protein
LGGLPTVWDEPDSGRGTSAWQRGQVSFGWSIAVDLGRAERDESEDEQDHYEGDGDGERDDGDRAGVHGGSERMWGNC